MMLKLRNLKSLVIIIAALSSYFMTAMLSILAVTNDQASITLKLLDFFLLMAVLAIFAECGIVRCSRRESRYLRAVFIIPIFIVITMVRYHYIHQVLEGYFKGYFICTIPALIAGILFLRINDDKSLISAVNIAIILITAGIVRLVIDGRYVHLYQVHGANYQSISNLSAISIMLIFYVVLFYKRNGLRIKQFQKLLLLFCIILAFYCLIKTQGRSAALASVIILFFFLNSYSKISFINRRNIIFLCVMAVSFMIVLLNLGIKLELIINGRLASTIFNLLRDPSDFLLNDTRGKIYIASIQSFLKSPICGRGIGSVFYEIGFYSHNIILDVLCETGIIGLIAWLIVFRSIVVSLKGGNSNKALFVKMILLEGVIMLLFSGYYLYNSQLWFSIGYACAVKKINQEVEFGYKENSVS